MPTFRLLAVLLATAYLACSGSVPVFPVDDLDFAEIRSANGWQLRIYGDGSAALRHRTLPAHVLDYPTGTFDVGPARRISRECERQVRSPVCVTLRYYTAFNDEEVRCSCAPGNWPSDVIDRAIRKMDVAVEGGGSRVSRRMLARVR